MDFVATYRGARGRMTELLGHLSSEDADRPVPGTPLWTVHDLCAHLVGVTADAVSGNTAGMGTSPWTARQVEERGDLTIDVLLNEWDEQAPAVERMLEASVPWVAIDALTHEHDLRGALGRAGTDDLAAIQAAIAQLVERALGKGVDQAGLPGVRLVGGASSWVAGTSDVGATVDATSMEFFRSLTGRRSGNQVSGYQWDGDPEPYLALWNVFGPLPQPDVKEAGA
jgi:uncharacterized protein (TIGR03083 family)